MSILGLGGGVSFLLDFGRTSASEHFSSSRELGGVLMNSNTNTHMQVDPGVCYRALGRERRKYMHTRTKVYKRLLIGLMNTGYAKQCDVFTS